MHPIPGQLSFCLLLRSAIFPHSTVPPSLSALEQMNGTLFRVPQVLFPPHRRGVQYPPNLTPPRWRVSPLRRKSELPCQRSTHRLPSLVGFRPPGLVEMHLIPGQLPFCLSPHSAIFPHSTVPPSLWYLAT